MMESPAVLALALFIFLTGMALLLIVHRKQKASGLPAGRVISSDMHRWATVEKALYSQELKITGRPDYLVEQGDRMIPVEVKSSRIDDGPYDSHIYQLAAYCHLVEITFYKRPAYGILHYPNQTYAIDYTNEMEQALIAVVTEMHLQGKARQVDRSHEAPQRCRGCGYRTRCEQKLI